jgi:hypothetical protein
MAWFRNYYICERCDSTWSDEWSCMCDDDCPHCDARHMSPFKSDDLTKIIEPREHEFIVLESPETAEHQPNYYLVATLPTRKLAEAFLAKYR